MQLQTQDQDQDMAIRFKFIAKVTNMGDRTMVIFPKDQDKMSKHLRGKFARITIEEISVDEE